MVSNSLTENLTKTATCETIKTSTSLHKCRTDIFPAFFHLPFYLKIFTIL